jgi:NAD(P)-dependent dehydrogenase (short-subunit alcohol dehydrogenase family)
MFIWILILLTLLILYLVKKHYDGPYTKLRRKMNGKIVIITGSSSGLGKTSAFNLLQDGAEVIFACRDKIKTLTVLDEVLETLGNEARERVHFLKLDLNSFEDVFNFAKEVKAKFGKIDILMNNAGLYVTTNFNLSKNGIDSVFQTNHLSHMLLSFLLLDHFSNEGRIINISSIAHKYSDYSKEYLTDEKSMIFEEDFRSKYFANPSSRGSLYGNSKIAQIFFANYMSEFIEKYYSHVKIVSLHPGVVRTEFWDFFNEKVILKYCKYVLYPIFYIFFKSPIAGAQTQLHLCYMDQEEIANGAYYSDCKLGKLHPKAKAVEIKDAFIGYSWKLIKSKIDVDTLKSIPESIKEFMEKSIDK